MLARILFILAVVAVVTGCSPPRGIYHQVDVGQTLFTISKIYQVDAKELARINGIPDPARLRAGQRLFIPGADRERKVPATLDPAAKTPAQAPPAVSGPATESKGAAKRAEGVAARTPTGVARRGAAGGGGERKEADREKRPFVWPVKGDIVRHFGRRGNQTCQGVEIAASAGTAVVSAAAGRVTYSGKGIRGYGHLIILRHEGEFFTVYGYNQQGLVAAGDMVKQGQRIAVSGAPPGGGSPRLHFEIRKGKSPVNPIFYLP